MSVDGIAKLVEASGKLIGAIVWPAAISYIVVRFRTDISRFVAALEEITIKGAGFEASAKKKQSGDALAAAVVTQTEAGVATVNIASAVREAIKVVGNVSSRTIRQIEKSTILWVDDNPNNNSYEKQALELLGVRFVLSTSTDDALEKIKIQIFDLIISDMERSSDPHAGYTLLDRVRSSGNQTPYIIYAGSDSDEHNKEARRRGAIGCTNRATELFLMVISALSD